MRLERRADWLVLATRLVLLRSRLLLPSTPEMAGATQAEAKRELSRLKNLQFLRTAAGWLEARPQLGRNVFTAPRRERDPRVASYMRLMEACRAVLEREEQGQQSAVEGVYRPVIPALFRIPDALARIRQQLAEGTEATPLKDFFAETPRELASPRPRRAVSGQQHVCRCS